VILFEANTRTYDLKDSDKHKNQEFDFQLNDIKTKGTIISFLIGRFSTHKGRKTVNLNFKMNS